MVTSCKVVGCAQNRSNAQKEGFFRLPSMVNTVETSEKLSGQRRDTWLSRINRKDLTPPSLQKRLQYCMCVVVILFWADQHLCLCLKSLKRELNSFKYDETKFSNGEHNRVSYYTACFNTLITLVNLVKSEIKSGNKSVF